MVSIKGLKPKPSLELVLAKGIKLPCLELGINGSHQA